MKLGVNFLTTNLLGMSRVDQIQLGPQFNLGEEHQYKIKIDIDVAVSFLQKNKQKKDQSRLRLFL